jgi:hypothetical protein
MLAVLVGLAHAEGARAGLIYLKSCSAYGDSAVGAWVSKSKGAKMSAYDKCPEGGALQLLAEGKTFKGDYAEWTTTAPTGSSLGNANIRSDSVLLSPKASEDGYRLSFRWSGGASAVTDSGRSCCGGMDYGSGLVRSIAGRWFQIQVMCRHSTCPFIPGQVLDVKGIQLTATDTTPPAITPDQTTTNLANEAGRWIRGSWDTGFSADSEVGVCRAELLVDGVVVARGPSYTPRTGSWTQCGQGAGTQGGSGVDAVSHTLNTTSYANGPLAAEYYAADAAQPANVRGASFGVKVDNSPVSLSLAGPTQALTTDGAQTIRATAAAGPSGLSGIWCSVNAGPWVVHPASTADVSVSAPGLDTVVCYARNNAVDETGATARSPLQTWTIDIRKPSVSLISVQHVADALRCREKLIKVRVPGHWTTAWYHGHRIRIRVPGQTRRVRVHRCHPRVRIVVVHRDGQTVREHVVALPHRVNSSHERTRFGIRTTISGWLGEPDGTGLAGQSLDIQVAPTDGSPRFALFRTVRTSSNGTWTVHLPAGPSRLVEATFAGNRQLAPSTSNPVSITVRGSLSLRISPSHTHWGSTIRISGRLRGGYVPPAGELVVLRIGWRGGSAEIGHVYAAPSGRFWARYTFLRGTGSETYRIWAQSVRESDYPYAPATSRRVRVHVSA